MSKNKLLRCDLCHRKLVESATEADIQKLQNIPTNAVLCCDECRAVLEEVLPGHIKVHEEF